jgi:hypothetical protein
MLCGGLRVFDVEKVGKHEKAEKNHDDQTVIIMKIE